MSSRRESLDDVIDEIRKFPRTTSFTCCEKATEVSILQMYAPCPVCKTRTKLRGFGPIGTETQDLIDEVLAWMGTGHHLAAVLRRKSEIDEAREAEKR